MPEIESREQLRERTLTRRREVVSALENERGTKVITLIHRREPWEDEPKDGAEVARLTLASVQRFILWLLADKLPQQAAAQTAEFLTGGYLAHDTPIMFDAARNLGLPVNAHVPGRVYELFETCAFGLCKRPCLATYGMVDTQTIGLQPGRLDGERAGAILAPIAQEE